MPKFASPTELRKMPLADLQRDIRDASTRLAKIRLEVRLGKQKDTALYVREKKNLACMKTIAAEKLAEKLREEAANSKVNDPASAASESSVSAEKSIKKTSPAKS